MDEELKDQTNNRPWLYKKGQSGNPKGRPPGTFSLKEYVKKKLASMTDEEREEYLEGLDKKTIWEMGEGKPQQDTGVTFKEPVVIQWGNASNNSVQTTSTDVGISPEQSPVESISDPQTVWEDNGNSQSPSA